MGPAARSTATRSSALTGSDQWGRRRLLITLACVVSAAAVLVFGLGYAVYAGLKSGPGPGGSAASSRSTQGRPAATVGKAHREQVAAAPMLDVSPDDARGGVPATVPVPSIAIPAATGLGPVDVPTGYPQTPAGAVGQLAAIEVTVLQAMSIQQAGAIYHGWAMPGGVGAGEWELTQNVQAFLGRNSVGQAKAITTTVTANPAAAQVKGSDGGDWVLACVLLDVHAIIITDAQIGYGYCAPMQWVGGAAGRWKIGPGPAAARAPSTWPGTDLSVRAGWRSWTGQQQPVSRP